jgi:hypothetical protein
MLMAARSGTSYVKASLEELRNLRASWALGHPRFGVSDKQVYKQIIAITGR